MFSDITKQAVAIRGTRVTNLNFKIREGSLQGLNFTSESFELCFTEIIEWAQDEIYRMEGKTSSSYARAGWDDFTIQCNPETYLTLHPLLISKLWEYNLKLSVGKTEMYAHALDRDKPIFKAINTELNIPPATVKLTCINTKAYSRG